MESHAKHLGQRMQFYLVDVFADQPLTGNPLAVVPQADALTVGDMQKIAGELNQAETTFIVRSPRGADWRLRSFTARGVEVFGAGHNSLGAWWWLAESGTLALADGRNAFTQEIGDRLLPVMIESRDGVLQSVTLTQAPPVFGKRCDDVEALAAALGIGTGDVSPGQTVSTGAAHLLVPVKDRAAVASVNPNSERLRPILADAGAQGCYVYCLDPESREAIAHARFFNPTVGIAEDSATGSAAGPLACQLIAIGVAREGVAIAIEQGYEMGRPSLLSVRVRGGSVELAGRCVTVASGALRVR
ncbi:MAG TPA: PhzF family phenazine biosynthesis protein [Bryobacteraceae bacterium]|nr:PhzF family phenazine biosynthesis protein [Bryobacteraceae bacterium]